MMKQFIAAVTYEGKLEIIEREYPTKKAFAEDLRGNGFRIRFISTPETFDDDCYKYHDAVEKTKRIHKAQYDSLKDSAKRMGMTVKEYKAWLNS